MIVKAVAYPDPIEVEVEVDLDDVLASLPDRRDGVLRFITGSVSGLERLTAEDIEQIEDKHRTVIVEFLEKQVARFRVPEPEKVAP